MRIAFVAQELEPGGAEHQLYVLTRGLVERGHQVVVLVLRGGGRLEGRFRAAGVPLRIVGSSRWWPLALVFRLPQLLWSFRPEIVHGYLPRANCVAVASRLLRPGSRAVMGVRSVNPERQWDSRGVRALYAVEAWCSRFASAAISNSGEARAEVIRRGFPGERVHVVPNGIDTDRFTFDPARRKKLRAGWRVEEGTLVVGRIAGLRRIKDYPAFLQAAALVAGRRPDIEFVCAGDGAPETTQALHRLATSLELDRRLRWIGHHPDPAGVMSALDVLVSSSRSESFPNVVAEAMACGVPCVVTAVGESAAIVGDTGITVPAGDPEAMADAILELLDRVAHEGAELRRRTRQRILDNFSVHSMVEFTEGLLRGRR
jgi:glycosyltransferase involved in cell wall biosynthesis